MDIYNNESRLVDAIGEITNNISIGEFKWDASNNRFYIPISHVVSTMNGYTLKVKAFSHGGYSSALFNSIFVTPHYTLPSLEKNFVNFKERVGIGTTSPQTKLHVRGSEGHNSYNPQEDLLHVGGNELGGNGGYAGIRIGGTSNGMYYTSIRSVKTNNYGGYWNNALTFNVVKSNTYSTLCEVLRITSNENVGIGTTAPSEKLTVNGNIKGKKLIISQVGWSDYVFHRNYKLRPIAEVEKFIKTNQHLPDVPSAKEVASKGISVGDTQALLLKKIEELTLYIIELKKENIQQNKLINKIIDHGKVN
jgi:hypothetical protein